MKKPVLSFFILLLILFASSVNAAQRGIQVTVKSSSGKNIDLYKNSYALVVGIGDYSEGWDPLPGALKDVEEVAHALEKNGFTVKLKKNLTRTSFLGAFSEFVELYGRDEMNRLLFYFAGHGHTREMATGEMLGYLVMVDSPRPEKNPVGFTLSSIDMHSLVTQAKMVRARHVLFMRLSGY